MSTPRLPVRYRDWSDFEEQHNVEFIPYLWMLRCRACRTEWVIPQNRGKPLQRFWVCDNGCNGKPSTSSGGKPPMLVRRLHDLHDRRAPFCGSENPWTEGLLPPEAALARLGVHRDSKNERPGHIAAKRAQKLWFTVQLIDPAKLAELDRLFDEAAMQPDPLSWRMRETARLRRVDRG